MLSNLWLLSHIINIFFPLALLKPAATGRIGFWENIGCETRVLEAIKGIKVKYSTFRHCEERSDVAISVFRFPLSVFRFNPAVQAFSPSCKA